MRSQEHMLNDCSDMDLRSASSTTESGMSSYKTDVSISPSVDKESNSSFISKQENNTMDDSMLTETKETNLIEDDAPSDEEGDLASTQKIKQTWELRDGMVKLTAPRIRSTSIGGENDSTDVDQHPCFEKAKLKWDDTTARLTRRRVDLLGAQSWHGKRSSQEAAPVKHRSAPRKRPVPSEKRLTDKTVESGFLRIPEVPQHQESGMEDAHSLSPPGRSRGNIEIPSAFLRKEPEADEQSIGIPTPSTARNKFAAMSQSANLEASTTSFLAELPQIPRRWRCDDDSASVTSSVIRGGRVYKIQAPSAARRLSSSAPKNPMSGRTFPSSNSLVSRTVTSSTPDDSTDDDITEYDTVIPLNDALGNGTLERLESGSSFNPSINTYEDLDVQEPLVTIPSAGSDDQDDVELVPLNDAPTTRKAPEFNDYEDDLQEVEGFRDNDFVVDKVPRKKRWSSRNLHNFPVWPPIIKVQTWQRKNVSAVSIGSGFTFDDSFTDSNAVVSSLGDDDISYEEEEFIRRPPEHRTSYRIRYDGPTSLRLEDVYKPPISSRDDRFEPTGQPSDGVPNMPARRVVDAAPSAPPRSSACSDLDDMSITPSVAGQEDEGNNRPDVWITPLAGSMPAEAMWKVRRVWAVELEDEKEQEHSVHNHELFEKIKSLVGARENSTELVGDNAPQLPQRSWHVQTVFEKRGYVENVAADRSLDDIEFEVTMKVMAEDAVIEIQANQKVFEEFKMKRELQKAEEVWIADLNSSYVSLEVDDRKELIEAESFSEVETAIEEEAIGANSHSIKEATKKEISELPRPDVAKGYDNIVSPESELGPTVTSEKELDLIVTSEKEPDPIVTSEKELEPIVTAEKELDPIVTSEKEQDPILTSEKELDLNVTSEKELDPIVTSEKELDLIVASEKEFDSIVTSEKEQDPIVTSEKEFDPIVTSEKEFDSIVASKKEQDPILTSEKQDEPEVSSDLKKGTDEPRAETDASVTKKKAKKKKKANESPRPSPTTSKESLTSDLLFTSQTLLSPRKSPRLSKTLVTDAAPPLLETPKKSKRSKAKTGGSSLSSLSPVVSPTKLARSKPAREASDCSQSPKVPSLSRTAVPMSTPRAKKSKMKLVSPKPKSPKKEKSKTESKKKSKERPNGDNKEQKETLTETQTPRIKKKVVSMTELIRADNDSSEESVEVSSSSSDSVSISNQVVEASTSSRKLAAARVSLAAMVQDTDSEDESSEGDDELSLAASTGPRIVRPTSKSPRRSGGWWNTPGGSKRRTVPRSGIRPNAPPLNTEKESSETG